jgi:glycine cleavage system H protein
MATIEQFEFPDDLFYDAKEHLWLRPEGSRITIGVDDGGQDALGDVVYVQLNAPSQRVSRGDAIGSIEAAKMVRPLLAPIAGTVIEVNAAAMARPRLLNDDPYGEGWLFKIDADDWASELGLFLRGTDAVAAWVHGELAAHGRA